MGERVFSFGISTRWRVDWSNLPEEIWPMIGKCLNSNIDILRFRSICKSWRSSLLPSLTFSPCFPREITTSLGQCLLIRTTIYCLEPSDSDLSKSLSNSSFSKAWLIKVGESKYGCLRLLHPFTNGRLSYFSSRYPCNCFPRVLNLLNFRFVELIKAYSYKSENERGKVVFFPNSSRTEVENCMLFSVHRDGKLGFSKIGDTEWTLVDDKNFYYDDILVHKGQLYVVDKRGTISWIDCSSLKLVQFSPPLCGLGKKKHLIESCGSLYVVDIGVVDVQVYKLDEEWGRWWDVRNLGKRAFVLSRDCNFSLSAQDYYGCEENCIYFCDGDSAAMFNLETSTLKDPEEIPSTSGTHNEVVDVKVYKLDEEWGRWWDVRNLEKRGFVLSKDCSSSLSAYDYHGCQENCIYFCYSGGASMFNLETYIIQVS